MSLINTNLSSVHILEYFIKLQSNAGLYSEAEQQAHTKIRKISQILNLVLKHSIVHVIAYFNLEGLCHFNPYDPTFASKEHVRWFQALHIFQVHGL